MLRHSYIPEGMLISPLIPIPKNKKNSKNSSENYRAVALSSILGKVLNLITCIMKQNSVIIKTCNYQFGFKQKYSTSMCSFVCPFSLWLYYTANNNFNLSICQVFFTSTLYSDIGPRTLH